MLQAGRNSPVGVTSRVKKSSEKSIKDEVGKMITQSSSKASTLLGASPGKKKPKGKI